jgi:hypothetical protein
MVPVIDVFTTHAHKLAVHGDRFAVIHSECIVAPCRWIVTDVPEPLREISVFALINNCPLAFSQSDVSARFILYVEYIRRYWQSVGCRLANSTQGGGETLYIPAHRAPVALQPVLPEKFGRMRQRLGNSLTRAHVPPRLGCAGQAALKSLYQMEAA